MKPMLLTPVRVLPAALLLAGGKAGAAVIPPERVKADVYDAKVTSITRVQDPVEGQQLWLPYTGLAGMPYHLRGSTNLLTWSVLNTQTATGGSGIFKQPHPDGTRRFYRIEFAPTSDTVAPTWTGGAAMTAGFIHDNWADLDWPAANDNTGVIGYALYRNGIWVSFIINAASGAYMGGLEPNTVYEFDVVACDAGGNVTQLPGTLTMRTRSQQEPYLNSSFKGGVSVASGDFCLNRTDIRIPGREMDFHFTRTYRSQVERSGPLGYGWTANVFESLKTRHDSSMTWLQGNGRADTFVKQPDGSFTAPPGFFMTLLPQPDGFRLIDASGLVRRFDPEGRILSINTRNGNTHTYQYNAAGRLASVTDEMGHVITFNYDLAGTLAYISDFTGREVRFTYDAAGNLTSVRSPVATTGVIAGDTFPAGKTERYTYDTESAAPQIKHNLKQIFCPNEISSLTPRWELGMANDPVNFDRVISCKDGGTNASGVPSGGTVTFTYTVNPASPGRVFRTSALDARLFRLQFDFNSSGQCTALLEDLPNRKDPLTTFLFNADGNLLTTTHPEGNVTNFLWDSAHSSRRSQGNLLRITRTPGPRGGAQPEIVTQFTYEPVFNQLRSVTNPKGKTEMRTFDFEENPDFAAIGAKAGLSASAAQTLLNSAGMCLAPLGDVNGDVITNQSGGNLIRQTLPSATLFAGGRQALAEGDTSQGMENFYYWNAYGQMTMRVDAEINSFFYTYWSERDPDGDGIVNNPSGNATTGGWLRQRQDDVLAAMGRNSDQMPTPINRRTQWKYSPRGAVTSVTDPRGVVTDVLRNELDQVIRVRRAVSIDPAFVPSPAEPQALTALGFYELFAYDANNNLIRHDVEDRGDMSGTGGVVTTTYQYDIRDLLLAKTDEIDSATTATTRYRYCPNGNLALMILPEGNAKTWRYDLRDLPEVITTGALTAPPEAQTGSLTSPFNPRGGTPSTVNLHWDDNGLLDAATDAADTDGSAANNGSAGGDLTTFTYDGYNRRTSSVDPAGNRTAWSYDADGNCIQEQHFGPNGGPTPLTNTPSTNLLAQTGFVYDEADRLVQTNQLLFSASLPAAEIAEGATAMGKGNLVPGDGAVNNRFEYDRLGRLTAVHEDDGDMSAYDYDGAGRLLRCTAPSGDQMEYAYDDTDNVIESRRRDIGTGGLSEPDVFLTTNFHDAAGRLLTTVNNLGHTTRYEYDSRDNVTATSDGNGPLSGSITRRAFPDAFTTVNATNSHGNVVRYARDGIKRVKFEVWGFSASGTGNGTMNPPVDANQGGGDGQSIRRYFYDRNGLLTSLRDDNGFSTAFTYDNLNRLTQETRGACTGPALAGYTCDTATTTSYTYDADGNVVTKSDAAGNVFTHSYDALNRLKQVNIARGPGVGGVTQQQFEFDGLSRPTRSTDNGFNGTSIDIYDSLGRVVRETLELPGTGTFTCNSAWRAENLRTALTYSTGTVITYTYDAGDRIRHIQDGSATVADYDYIGGRLLEERFGNGAKNSHVGGYNGLGQPVQVESRRSGGALLTRFTHTWNRAGSRLTESKTHDAANNQAYAYDSMQRLVSFTRPALGAAAPLHSSWNLDGTGNWKSVDGATRNISSFNEINSVTPLLSATVPLSYDNNGNLTGNPTAQSGASAYQFDAFNRLITASVSGGPSLTYGYDAAGRRILEIEGTTRRVAFLHDGDRPIVDWDALGTLTGTPGTAGRLREFVQGPDTGSPARMQNAAGTRFFYHRDSLGSPAALTPAATVSTGAEFVRYEAYGAPAVSQSGGLAPTGNPFLFNGQRRDFGTGIYQCGTRHYDAALGTYLSRDPDSFAEGYVARVPRNIGEGFTRVIVRTSTELFGNSHPYARDNCNPVNGQGNSDVYKYILAIQMPGMHGSERFNGKYLVSGCTHRYSSSAGAGAGERFNGKYLVQGCTHRFNGKYYVTGTTHKYSAGAEGLATQFAGDTGTHEIGHWMGLTGTSAAAMHLVPRPSGGVPGACSDWIPVLQDNTANITTGAGPGQIFGASLTGPGPGPVFGPQIRGIYTSAGPGDVFGPHFRGSNGLDPGQSSIITGAGPGAVFGPHFRGSNGLDPGRSSIITGAGPGDVFAPHFTGPGPGQIFGIMTGPGPGSVFGPQTRAFAIQVDLDWAAN